MGYGQWKSAWRHFNAKQKSCTRQEFVLQITMGVSLGMGAGEFRYGCRGFRFVGRVSSGIGFRFGGRVISGMGGR